MRTLVEIRPDALFIQSESSEYFHAAQPQAIKLAETLNARRFLSLDLNYGKRVDSEMYEYLLDNGMTREENHFFHKHDVKHRCILGNDYYVTNEHRVTPDGNTSPAGEVFGYDESLGNTVGLYDLDRNPRAVGKAYKQLIEDWRDVPTQTRREATHELTE